MLGAATGKAGSENQRPAPETWLVSDLHLHPWLVQRGKDRRNRTSSPAAGPIIPELKPAPSASQMWDVPAGLSLFCK